MLRLPKLGTLGTVLAVSIAYLRLSLPAAGVDDLAALDSLAREGHWKRVRQIVQQHPGKDAASLYWQARVKRAFGELEAAESLAKQAIATDSTKAAYHQALAAINLDQLGARPGIIRIMHLAHDIKSELETAISLEPRNTDAKRQLMTYLWHAPSIGGGDRKKAQELAADIGKIDAVLGYLAQAELAELAGGAEMPKAEALLGKALQAAPEDYKVRCALADFYLSGKQFGQAEGESRAAIGLSPHRERAYTTLANIQAQQNKGEALDEVVAKAEEAVPEDWNPEYQAAKTLVLAGTDLDRAERYLRHYLTQEPEGEKGTLGSAHWRLGLIFEKRGNKAKAVEELQTAIRLDPTLSDARTDLDRLK